MERTHESLPASAMNSQLATSDISSTSLVPTTPECIAHLKLLEAFHQLHEDIAATDGLFGITDGSEGSPTGNAKIDYLAKVREKRWAVYVARAADRFQAWWDKCVPQSQPRLGIKDLGATHEFDRKYTEGQPLSLRLPPLGVCDDPFKPTWEADSQRCRCHHVLAQLYAESKMLL